MQQITRIANIIKSGRSAIKFLFYLYTSAVLYFSTANPGTVTSSGSDKLDHAAGFLIFALLLAGAYEKTKPLGVFLRGLGFGLLIEFIQSFISYRSAEFGDVVADCAGLLVGILLLAFMRKVFSGAGDTDGNNICSASFLTEEQNHAGCNAEKGKDEIPG